MQKQCHCPCQCRVVLSHQFTRNIFLSVTIDIVFWYCSSCWTAVVSRKNTTAGFSDQLYEPWWDLLVSKQQSTVLVALRQEIKKYIIRKWNTNHYIMVLGFFGELFFLWKLINVRSQILKDMNVNVAAFPTALIDVNTLGYKCCLQNIIRILTLCLIWCFCFQGFFWGLK